MYETYFLRSRSQTAVFATSYTSFGEYESAVEDLGAMFGPIHKHLLQPNVNPSHQQLELAFYQPFEAEVAVEMVVHRAVPVVFAA